MNEFEKGIQRLLDSCSFVKIDPENKLKKLFKSADELIAYLENEAKNKKPR